MITIAVTDTGGSEDKFRKYITWLEGGGTGLRTEVLSYGRGNGGTLDRCDGLLLTGGHDVSPELYGGPAAHPSITGTDPRRDEFEIGLLTTALDRGIPLLGICRGMQIAAVCLGGSLIPDLVEAGYRPHRTNDGECRHAIAAEPATSFAAMIGALNGEVNSSHHQAVAGIPDRLRLAARSDDGIVEALELRQPAGHSFFCLVQYHPERMADAGNVFARNLLNRFLQTTTISHSHSQNRIPQ